MENPHFVQLREENTLDDLELKHYKDHLVPTIVLLNILPSENLRCLILVQGNGVRSMVFKLALLMGKEKLKLHGYACAINNVILIRPRDKMMAISDIEADNSLQLDS